MEEPLLEIKNLTVKIKNRSNFTAVDHLSLTIKKGEIFGLIGESGSGKSLTALSIAGLLPSSAIIFQGKIRFNNTDLLNLNRRDLSKIQGKDISMIFQEPMTALNPLQTAGRQISENLKLHTSLSKEEMYNKTIKMLSSCGFQDPEQVYKSYPHQLSGGMRQRVMIAMAVICSPKLLIADEPTTALDATVQKQILELIKKIGQEIQLSVLFISHDLSVIRGLCSRAAVMYKGRIVEQGDTEELFHHPAHAYTKALLGAIPTPDKKGKRLEFVSDEILKSELHTPTPEYINLGQNHIVMK